MNCMAFLESNFQALWVSDLYVPGSRCLSTYTYSFSFQCLIVCMWFAKYENYHIGDSARSNRSSLRLARILSPHGSFSLGKSDQPD
jgi:hypothetical protein